MPNEKSPLNSIEFVKDLNDRYFNGELSTQFQEVLGKLPMDRPDVFDFVKNVFVLMNASGMPAKDASLQHAEALGSLLGRILPGAWEGRVPPITVQGRHAVIDRYIKNNHWIESTGRSMLDIGCGFPPVTTKESADFLGDWQVTGADPSIPAYLIYDEEGNYATFDENRSTVYFQPAIPSLENWNRLLSNSNATRRRFEELLSDLMDDPNDEGLPRLEVNPVKNYETGHLSFILGGIGEIDIEPQDVIRCFNVLYYFDNDFMEKALKWFGEKTREGGIVIFGGDWAASTECYYNIHKKIGTGLVNMEFVFSLDCICPLAIVTWYSMHDDDRQKAALVKCIGIIRKDRAFMDEFYLFHDAQRLRYKLCPRDDHGYYGSIDPSIQPQELAELAGKMLTELNDTGFNQKAVEVLRRAGLSARVNEVGHIAVEPDQR